MLKNMLILCKYIILIKGFNSEFLHLKTKRKPNLVSFVHYFATFTNLLITASDLPVPIATDSNGFGAI